MLNPEASIMDAPASALMDAPADALGDLPGEAVETVDAPERPVQVAGLIDGMLRGALGKIGGAARSRTSQIREGVLKRSVPTVPEDKAQAIVQDMGKTTPLEPGRTEMRNFRLDKFDTPEDGQRMIDTVANDFDGFMAQRRGKVSWAQTAAESENVALEDLLGRKPAQAWNAAQLQAGRHILLDYVDQSRSMAAKIMAGQADDETKLAFRQLLAQQAALQAQLSGAVAEAGRALNIMKSVTAQGGRLRSSQVQEAFKTLGGDNLTLELARIVEAADSPVAVLNAARKGYAARSLDALQEVWINGLLSTPATHAVNLTSNSLFSALQVPERALAAVIGKLHRGDKVYFSEAEEMFYGSLAGFRDGLVAAGRALKTGKSSDILNKIETHQDAFTAANLGLKEDSALGRAVDLVGEYYVRLPGRALQAEDELFKTIGYRAELQARAVRTAKNEGLKGDALKARVNELINNPPEDLHMAAEQFSRYATFTNSLGEGGMISDAGQSLLNFAHRHPTARFVVPFIRTPTNITLASLERTPLAPLTHRFQAAIKAGGAERDLAIARATLGSTTSGVVALYAADGKISGSGPADPKLRKMMEATGWRPYSIKLGGEWVSYNRLDPVGALMGMSADAVDAMKYAGDEHDTADIGAAVAMGFAEAMTNKTYMQGIASLLEAVKSEDDGLTASKRWVARQAGSFVPGWLNAARLVMDEEKRSPAYSGVSLAQMTVDALKNRSPWHSTDLPPALDVWGEPIAHGRSGWNPIIASKEVKDEEAAEVFNNGARVDRPAPTLSFEHQMADGEWKAITINLNAIDPKGFLFNRYQQAAGRYAREGMVELMGDAGYQSLPEGDDRAREIEKVFVAARSRARDEMKEEVMDGIASDPVLAGQYEAAADRAARKQSRDTQPRIRFD